MIARCSRINGFYSVDMEADGAPPRSVSQPPLRLIKQSSARRVGEAEIADRPSLYYVPFMHSLVARRNAYIRCAMYNRRTLARHKWRRRGDRDRDSVSWATIERRLREKGEGRKIRVKRDGERMRMQIDVKSFRVRVRSLVKWYRKRERFSRERKMRALSEVPHLRNVERGIKVRLMNYLIYIFFKTK